MTQNCTCRIRKTYIYYVLFGLNKDSWKVRWKWNFTLLENEYRCNCFIYFDFRTVAVFCLAFSLYFVQMYDWLISISSIPLVLLNSRSLKHRGGEWARCMFWRSYFDFVFAATNHFKFGMTDIQSIEKP